MKKQNAFLVFLLPLLTCGIYSLYWLVTTKEAMRRNGADIPTAWLIVVPLAGIYWLWRFAKGIELVTKSKMGGVECFLVLLFLGPIGFGIVQRSINKHAF